MKLLLKLIYKDFKRNRVITIALAVFLMLSALLMAGGLSVTGTILSSLDGLNKVALPPDYLQMHKGTYDEEEMHRFVETHDYIKNALVVKMLNIENANLIYQGETLQKCLMENGFVTQNEEFDFLLNMNNEIVVVSDGEIGVPVYYAEEYGIQVGDHISVHKGEFDKELTVSTIIRDSSMNPALSYSKRLLISQTDLNEISLHTGEWEYIFEYLLEEGVTTSQIEKDYLDAGLPSNGTSVTGSLLTMMNGLSYGMVAVIIIAISILLIMVALLCLAYIMKATMAEESKTIGEMKAIGFSEKTIEKIYQMKYIMLMLIAGVLGFIAAIPLGDFASASVILYCGKGYSQWTKWVFPFVGVMMLCLFVIVNCRKIIRRNLKRTVVELMRGEEAIQKEGHYSLPKTGLKHRNLTMAFGELKCKWKEYVVIFLVFAFSSFLILLPMNMRNTIKNPSFISYMGVGKCDIRIHIQFCDNLLQKKETILSYIKNDSEIDKYVVCQNANVQCQNAAGEWVYIRVGNGNESIFPLDYLKGKAPASRNEIALSYLNSNELGKDVGDILTVNNQGENLQLTVCGVYQDITYGGKTTKAMIDIKEDNVEGYIIFLTVKDGVSIEDKTNELRGIPVDCKVMPVSEFVSQTLGGVMDNMKVVESTAIVISLLLAMLITAMFLQLITAREHSAIAIKKAIGFSNRDIEVQLGIRILLIQVMAIMVGTILANLLGEVIFGWMLSSMGASKITMLTEPITAYLLCPAAQLFAVFITVIVGTKVIRNYHIRDEIME